MSTTIEDRVILLLREKNGGQDESPASSWLWPQGSETKKYGFWENLAGLTGISAQRWRKAYMRRQRPTPDMIEALSRLFPEHAFWIATGITDATNGHIAPMTAMTFPERLYAESLASKQYFRKSIDLFNKLFVEGQIDTEDEKQRMYAAERTMPLAHWVGSPLLDTAYQIAKTPEYEEFRGLWEEREAQRKEDLDRIEGRNRPWTEEASGQNKSGLRKTPILGTDPRTAHQDHWDLFYQQNQNDNQGS